MLVRCKHERRCSRARGEDVSFRDVTIETPDRILTGGMCMKSCTGSVRGGLLEIWEKSVSWVFTSEEEGWLLELAEAFRRVSHVVVVVGWADGKVSVERLCLSFPYVEKPFNSKAIKSFVPELRSRKCFLCFGIPMFYICALWTFYVYFTYSCMAMLHTHTHTHTCLYIYRDRYIYIKSRINYKIRLSQNKNGIYTLYVCMYTLVDYLLTWRSETWNSKLWVLSSFIFSYI